MISEKPRDFNPILMLKAFRMQMNSDLDMEHLKIFSDETVARYAKGLKLKNTIATPESFAKLNYAFDNVAYLLPFHLKWMVKYITVTGSVAADISGPDDDIDLFVVVRNHTSWIYRAFLMLGMRLRGDKKVRFVESRQVKNKFCLNFICEERGVKFEREDIFTFHELFYMKPIYTPEYFDKIKARNSWLEEWGVRGYFPMPKTSLDRNSLQRFSLNLLLDIILIPLNLLAFVAQFFFMIIRNHSPRGWKIVKDSLKGRIIFYGRGLHKKAVRSTTTIYNELVVQFGL